MFYLQIQNINNQRMNQQLQRILNTDIDSVSSQVNTKIKSLDMIHETLTERSTFINNFQSLLQKELSQINKNSDPKQQQKQNKPIKNVKKDSLKYSLKAMKNSLADLQNILLHNITQIKQSMGDEMVTCIRKIVQTVSDAYQARIFQLQSKITQLTQQLKEIKDNKQIKLDSSRSFDILSKNSLFQSKIPLTSHRTSVNYEFSESMILQGNQKKWKSYVCTINPHQPSITKQNKQNLNLTTKENQQQQLPRLPSLLKNHLKVVKYDLPTLKNVIISHPPVENGFGVFKMGEQIVYRGLWKYKKFDGRGKLCLPEYSYDGNFKYGLFDGRGSLKVGKYEFTGQFKQNKANGQGMMKINGHSISGRWQNNIFIQKYC